MPSSRRTVPLDEYVLDILMRDLVGHDQQPGAFLVYLYLYRAAQKRRWHPVVRSIRAIAEKTGLSKSAVQTALETLRRRELIESIAAHVTAARRHRVLRHWRETKRLTTRREPEKSAMAQASGLPKSFATKRA